MPIRKYNPTSPGVAAEDVADLRRDHDERAVRAADREAAPLRRPQQPGAADVVVARRRPQAALPDHRFQAGQEGHSRQGRDDRVRPEPLGADRARHLRRRREALHPAAVGHEGRRHDGGRRRVDILPGNCLPLKNIPLGTTIHNVELRPGKGGQIARSAGSSVQLVAREGEYASVKMPSGEIRKINVECVATIGQVGNLDHENVSIGKAGRSRWLGQAAARARRRDEPGGSPARRW